MKQLTLCLSLVTFCLLLSSVRSKVVLKGLDLSYDAVQLTPRGLYHPVVTVSDATLLLESPDISPERYVDKVLMMPYRPMWDDDACAYESLGVACIIIHSTGRYVAGANINKGNNRCTYRCVYEMLVDDYYAMQYVYQNVTLDPSVDSILVVDITDENVENQWKLMAYSAPFMINTVLSGLVCLIMIVGGTVNLALIKKKNKTHMTAWIIICVLLVVSGIVGIVGFVDFNCMLQVLPYRACNIFSAIRPAFVFAAINMLSYTFLDAVKMHVGGPKVIPSKFWVSCLISFIYLATTISFAVTMTFLTDYVTIIAVLSAWLAFELGYQTYTAVLNGVISIKTLIRLRMSMKISPKMGTKKNQVRRTITMLIIISSCTIIYVIFVGLVNESVSYPWYLVSTWFVYNTLLNIISLILLYSMYSSIMKNMDKKKTSSKENVSTELGGESGSTLKSNTEISRTESKLDLSLSPRE